MKKLLPITIVFVFLFHSCNNDDKASIEVLEEVERGAFLRTLNIQNSEFDINNLDSEFAITIQEQDKDDGELLQSVDVFVKFFDETFDGADYTSEEIFVETMEASSFSPGSYNLPVKDLNYSFTELLDLTQTNYDNVACKDKFVIRLNLKLTDGREFSNGNASGCILSLGSYFYSPFSYNINIVEPIEPESFTGIYKYESVVDGPFGPTFGPSFDVEIKKGRSDNLRMVQFDNFPSRPARDYFFTIACDETVFEEYQLRYNTLNLDCGENGQPILLGPDVVNAPINPNDDSVFEIWMVEGYKGYDGEFGFGTQPSRLRFTKQ